MPFKVVSQKGFLKGVIASMDRFNITKGAIQRASNFLLSQRGALTVCDGTHALATGGPATAIREMGMFVGSDFSIHPLAGAPDSTGNFLNMYSWNLGGGGFGALSTGVIPLTPGWIMPQFANFTETATPGSPTGSQPIVCIATGNATQIVKYDGSSFFNLGGTTPPGGGTPLTVIPRWQPNTFYQVGQRISHNDSNGVLATWQVVNVQISGSGTAPSGGATSTSGIGSGGMSGNDPFPPGPPSFTNDDAAVKGRGQLAHDNQLLWMCIAEDQGTLATTFPPRGAAHIITHANSLWALNTSPTIISGTGSMDGPSVLRMSDPNNGDSWPIGNTTIIGKDDGTQGTGLATFTIAEAGITPSGTLVVFKDYSTYTVQGVFQAADFKTNQVKTDMGCVASRTIVFATGFGIIRFSHLGFALFDGINDRLVSEEIRPYIFGDAVTPKVDFTRLAQGRATLVDNPPLYICMMPTTDALSTRIFVYDLVMRAWMILDYMAGPNTAAFPDRRANFPITAMNQLRPPYQTGFSATTVLADFNAQAVIRAVQAGDSDWDATTPHTPIGWSFRPPEVGEPGSRAYFRRANIRLTAPGPGVITGVFNIGEESQPPNSQPDGGANPSGGAGPSSGTPPNVASAATYYGNADLGVALDIHQTGPSLNGTFSGSGPANIEGVDYHIQSKEPRPFGQRF